MNKKSALILIVLILLPLFTGLACATPSGAGKDLGDPRTHEDGGAGAVIIMGMVMIGIFFLVIIRSIGGQ